jgi:dienelactone hydrolase
MTYALTIAIAIFQVTVPVVASLPTNDSEIQKQTIAFQSNDTDQTPERFRLKSMEFVVESEAWLDLAHSGITVTKIRFPSPVNSPYPVNNIVHGEYYCPKNLTSARPAVIVLDILDGSQKVSRFEALSLAQRNIPALIVYMAYYGPRRPEKEKVRMLMPDIEHSTAAVTQTVLDVRRAVAWLSVQPNVNAEKLGIVGTSLGSFLAGLTTAAEPRLKSACLLLSGGGLVEAFYDHPQAKYVSNSMKLLGISKEKLAPLINPLDPLTYAKELAKRRLLLIAASRDDVVPPSAAERLWKATGEQKIVWVDSTHVGAVLFAFQGINAIVAHIEGR